MKRVLFSLLVLAAAPAAALVVRVAPQAPRVSPRPGFSVAARVPGQSNAGAALRVAPGLKASLSLAPAPATEARPLLSVLAARVEPVAFSLGKGDLDGTRKELDALYNPRGRGGDELIPPGDRSSRGSRDDWFHFPEPAKHVAGAKAAVGDPEAALVSAQADFLSKSQVWTYKFYSPKAKALVTVTANFLGGIKVKKSEKAEPRTARKAFELEPLISLAQAVARAREEGVEPVSVRIKRTTQGRVSFRFKGGGGSVTIHSPAQAAPAALPTGLLARLVSRLEASRQQPAEELAGRLGLPPGARASAIESLALGPQPVLHGFVKFALPGGESGYALSAWDGAVMRVFFLGAEGRLERAAEVVEAEGSASLETRELPEEFAREAAFWERELGGAAPESASFSALADQDGASAPRKPSGQAPFLLKARVEQSRLAKTFRGIVEAGYAASGDFTMPDRLDQDESAEQLSVAFEAIEDQAKDLEELNGDLDEALARSQKETVEPQAVFDIIDEVARINVNLPMAFLSQLKDAVVKVSGSVADIDKDLAAVPPSSGPDAEVFKRKYGGETVEAARKNAEEDRHAYAAYLGALKAVEKAMSLPEGLTAELAARVAALTQALEKAAELGL